MGDVKRSARSLSRQRAGKNWRELKWNKDRCDLAVKLACGDGGFVFLLGLSILFSC